MIYFGDVKSTIIIQKFYCRSFHTLIFRELKEIKTRNLYKNVNGAIFTSDNTPS